MTASKEVKRKVTCERHAAIIVPKIGCWQCPTDSNLQYIHASSIQPLGGCVRKVWRLNCEAGTEEGLMTYYYILVEDRLLAPSANLCFLHELKANRLVELHVSKKSPTKFHPFVVFLTFVGGN